MLCGTKMYQWSLRQASVRWREYSDKWADRMKMKIWVKIVRLTWTLCEKSVSSLHDRSEGWISCLSGDRLPYLQLEMWGLMGLTWKLRWKFVYLKWLHPFYLNDYGAGYCVWLGNCFWKQKVRKLTLQAVLIGCAKLEPIRLPELKQYRVQTGVLTWTNSLCSSCVWRRLGLIAKACEHLPGLRTRILMNFHLRGNTSWLSDINQNCP